MADATAATALAAHARRNFVEGPWSIWTIRVTSYKGQSMPSRALPGGRPFGCLIALVAILVAMLAAARVGQAFWERIRPSRVVEAPPPLVEVVALRPQPFESTVRVSGTLEPVQSVDVYTKVEGRVVALHTALGAAVRPGDPLATVEAVEWSLQARQAAAGADMASQAADVAGQTLGRLDRVHEALGAGALSDQEYDLARLQARSAETQAEVARLQRDLARRMVENATLTSPIEGRVTRVNARPGGMVGREYPSFHVDDTSSFVLRCEVGDLDLPRLAKGQRVVLSSDALPGRALEGVLTAISPSLDAWTRRAPIEVSVANPSGEVAGNLFVHGHVVVAHDDAAFVVPLEAVNRAGEGAVLRVAREGRVVKLPVVVTGESDAGVAIRGEGTPGPVPGDLVILPGPVHLSEGDPVRVPEGRL